MPVPELHLTGARATLLATLYGRALDAESPRSVLHDTMALETVRRIDFDFTRTGLRRGEHTAVALRARHLDGWTREFLAAHPASTVLHLGCGLDTRVHRVDPGPGVRWFDVDYPDVIDLRRQMYPPRGGYETVGSSVTDPSWLARVPGDLPVLVVAEGLTMYLRQDEGEALVRRIVGHFPGGQFVFDGFSRRGIRMQRFNRAIRAAGATVSWGMDSCAELEAIDPRLRCVTASGAFDIDGYDKLSDGYRLLAGVARLVPALRRMAVFYRLEF
ncbi:MULTISPECIES: class I SAM-dependent methyltransferase [unclassified Frankia]|uniref:class I SAM-dependent methyltransferase n=1 Tax=unclassified Frankia TaxID=2632575 RepID=UPI004043AFE0